MRFARHLSPPATSRQVTPRTLPSRPPTKEEGVKRHWIALAVGALSTLGLAAALATAASTDTETIDACRNLRHGLVRIVLGPDACKRNEAPVSWS